YLTDDFPVLSAGPTPQVDLDGWGLVVHGAVDEARSGTGGGRARLSRWAGPEPQALPRETVTVDIHCVTKWSKLDTVWTGVSVDTLLEGVETTAEYVTAYSDGGYTTNLPSGTSRAAKRGRSTPTQVNRSRPSPAAPRACSSRSTT